MRRNLVDTKQIFGQVKNHHKMPAALNGPKGAEGKPLGTDKRVGNNGRDDAIPHCFSVQHPSSHADNPFFWSGHPKRGNR